MKHRRHALYRAAGLALCLLLALAPASVAAGRLALPAGVTEVADEAFLNAAPEELVVPAGCETIGARAFAGSGLRRVYLPGSLTYIAGDAFDGCDGLFAVIEYGSYAQAWCDAHEVPYALVDEVPSTPVASVALDSAALLLEPGETARLSASVLPEDASQPALDWVSSDESVAAVGADGAVTAVAAGEAVVTARATDGSGAEAACAVSVGNQTQYRALLIGERDFYNSSGARTETAKRNEGDTGLMRAMLESVAGPNGRAYAGNITVELNLPKDVIHDAIRLALGGADENDVSLFFIATHGDYTSSGETAGQLKMSHGDQLLFGELAAWLSEVPGKVIVIVESCGSGAAIYEGEGIAAGNGIIAAPNGANGSEAGIDAADDPEAIMDALARFDRQLIEAFSAVDGGVAASGLDYGIAALPNSGEFRVENKFYVLTASQYQELSWGLTNYNMFTYWLTQGVGTSGAMPADTSDYAGDGDGVVTLYELYRYISAVGDHVHFHDAGYTQEGYQHVQAYPAVRAGSLELFKRR